MVLILSRRNPSSLSQKYWYDMVEVLFIWEQLQQYHLLLLYKYTQYLYMYVVCRF